MAAWIVVYGKRSLGRVMREQIRRYLDEADWMTIAEGYGIEDEKTVQAALNHFRVETLDDRQGEAYCIHYRCDRPKGRRQIDLERCTLTPTARALISASSPLFRPLGVPLRVTAVATVRLGTQVTGNQPP